MAQTLTQNKDLFSKSTQKLKLPNGTVLEAPDVAAMVNSLFSEQAKATPNPNEGLAKTEAAKAKALRSKKSLLESNPVPQQEAYQPGAMPQFPNLALPKQDTPRVDPIVGGLGVLAGAVLPEAAGRIQAATVEGAISSARESAAQRAQQYVRAIEAATRQYEAQLAQRNEENKARLINNDIKLKNAIAVREGALYLGNTGIEAELADDISRTSSELGEKQKAHQLTQEATKGFLLGVGLDQEERKLRSSEEETRARVGFLGAQTKTEDALREPRQGQIIEDTNTSRITGESKREELSLFRKLLPDKLKLSGLQVKQAQADLGLTNAKTASETFSRTLAQQKLSLDKLLGLADQEIKKGALKDATLERISSQANALVNASTTEAKEKRETAERAQSDLHDYVNRFGSPGGKNAEGFSMAAYRQLERAKAAAFDEVIKAEKNAAGYRSYSTQILEKLKAASPTFKGGKPAPSKGGGSKATILGYEE